MKKLVIFDFDDTIGHLTVNWARVKEELITWANRHGITVNPTEHIITIANMLSEKTEGKKAVVEAFSKHESECVRKKTYMMFPSMVALLKDLKKAGSTIAIATGNNVKTVKSILEAEGLSELVDLIIGIDSVRLSKPDAETLEIIIEKTGIGKEDAIFIGNSEQDFQAGKNAGMETVIIKTLWEDDVEMLRKALLPN